MTHLADVDSTTAAVVFSSIYRKPPDDTVSLCGTHITNGVVMQEGTKVRCRFCRRRDEKGLPAAQEVWEGEGGR